MDEKVYITTTLPYVNADPHIGFALEIVQADIFARYHRALGKDVFFNTGTDEHGQKIYEKALEQGIDPQQYVDEFANRFDRLKETLDLSYTNFIRTTDPHHIDAAQEFWRRCEKQGDIYKQLYKVKYCVGCELEKTDSELEEGKCPLHPNKELEIREEENYFFRFSKYQKKLLELYDQNPDFVVPSYRQKEIRAFVQRGLEDFSISRLKEKMSWGVPVPGDEEHVMYVWFDALVNYVSAINWPNDVYKGWWPVVQFAGKDNLRQQAAMWQAMLLSSGIEPSKQIVIHGFIQSDGQKMSKSLGNVIDPFEMVDEYGPDALRYYLARHIHPFEDSDFTKEKFAEAYTANLVNGLGNLVSRVMTMAVNYDVSINVTDVPEMESSPALDRYDFAAYCDEVWKDIQTLDGYIQTQEPFKKIKVDEAGAKQDVAYLLEGLYRIGTALVPIMPQTAAVIQRSVEDNKKPDALFPRK